ncbi:MAG: substrate-binding periplasmic protein [Isosphaeraceae bacterium]
MSLVRTGLVLIICGGLDLVGSCAWGDEPDKGRTASPAPKPLIVCAVPASMPRTGKAPDGKPLGLDTAVAERLGRVLGRPVEFHWCASAECGWHCLPEGRCDVVAGQPVDSGPPRAVAWSVPYAGAQFGLVVPRDAPVVRSLADLHGKRVGIVAGTVAISEKDHALARFKSREELLDTFGAAGLDGAFLDADFAAWYLHEHPTLKLQLVGEYVPRERWNMALAVRASDSQLLVEINRALAQLAESGAVRKIYTDHGVPFRAPFTASGRQPDPPPDTWRRVRDHGELAVSMDPANLPYSSAKDDRPGFDVELARALADRLHVKLRLDWLDIHRETAVGELIQGRCDLVFGEAVATNTVADDEPLAGKILYSRPYYGTGYVLVRRKDGPRAGSLGELKGAMSQRLGTEAGSVADYQLRRRGYFRRLYRNQMAVLKALGDGDIDFAYLWANAGWTLHVSPDLGSKLEVLPGFEPEDRWNIAIAMRRGDDEFKRQVDAALGTMIADGTVARALERYHVPHHPPSPEPAREPHAHADPARGTDMRKIQTSKHPYTALARVRSAGELVVGLDQGNLPFSTAHPVPAGLDYEIAGLLAGELGVSLRVYWAYSAHDSYPSKLAARQLCDVILGVMPDDRFAQRVLYSRPYYVSRYRTVIRSGEGPPSAREPMAVEEGVAVRGLEGRPTHPYPSTEAVLEAVATGREKAGYVIATRGPWLAHERWSGKLQFLPGTDTTDAFPIGAAVRKSDRELKDAIDQAWDNLERSGRLARVFERWHIPFERADERRESSP